MFLAYGCVALFLISGLLFVVNSRYRLPAAPWLCLFAGCGLTATLSALVHRRLRTFLGCLALLVVFWAATHLPFRREAAIVEQLKVGAFARDAALEWRRPPAP